jgi:hypothetical protein
MMPVAVMREEDLEARRARASSTSTRSPPARFRLTESTEAEAASAPSPSLRPLVKSPGAACRGLASRSVHGTMARGLTLRGNIEILVVAVARASRECDRVTASASCSVQVYGMRARARLT